MTDDRRRLLSLVRAHCAPPALGSSLGPLGPAWDTRSERARVPLCWDPSCRFFVLFFFFSLGDWVERKKGCALVECRLLLLGRFEQFMSGKPGKAPGHWWGPITVVYPLGTTPPASRWIGCTCWPLKTHSQPMAVAHSIRSI